MSDCPTPNPGPSSYPGDYDEKPDDVYKAIQLIETQLIPKMMRTLGSIAHTYGCDDFIIAPEALSMFRRRYRMSITKALSTVSPEDAYKFLEPVMETQARIAAAIAVFRWIKHGHAPTGAKIPIDKGALQRATHVLEEECHTFVGRKAAERAESGDSAHPISIFCS